jgi:hypothetical protein
MRYGTKRFFGVLSYVHQQILGLHSHESEDLPADKFQIALGASYDLFSFGFLKHVLSTNRNGRP